MYSSFSEFLKSWEEETGKTSKLLAQLTDASLEQKVWAEGRNLGFLAWHIVYSVGEMLSHLDIKVDGPEMNESAPSSAKTISDTYQSVVNAAKTELSKLPDTKLAESISAYGMDWNVCVFLDVLVRHEIHHRGQLTILMRQAGLQPVGVYGPAKEEWTSYNMPPQP